MAKNAKKTLRDVVEIVKIPPNLEKFFKVETLVKPVESETEVLYHEIIFPAFFTNSVVSEALVALIDALYATLVPYQHFG